MARGKKAVKELTPEEKLQQALVPVEEQPYPIPENWCWIKLSNVIELVSGRDVPLTDCNSEGIGIPYILGASNIENNTFTVERWIETPQIISNKGNILLSVKGTIGKLYIQQEEQINISRQIMAIQPLEVLNSKLVYLFLLLVCDELREAGNGLIPGISRADILDKAFPFVPFSEQTRIVSRIESLFAKLDEAKEKVQAVVDGFELRKSAILHKAFTGELTERWRKEYGVGMESWKRCLIGEVFDLQAGKNISAKEISSQQTDLYRYPCFGGNGIRGYVEQFNREGEHPIIGRQGALCGNINLANNQFYATEHAVVVSYKMDVSTPWAYHYLKFLDLNQYATATAQPGLAVSNIVKVPIQYIPFEEQQELSRILDTLLNKEQQAKEAAEAVLFQIDTMKKAILARAFRGELGTNDPAEESAAELIKSVL